MHCKKGDSFITKPAAKNNTVEQPRMSVSDDNVIVILRMMMVMTITMMLVMTITMMLAMTITMKMVTMKQINPTTTAGANARDHQKTSPL